MFLIYFNLPIFNLYIFTSGHDQYMLFGYHHKNKLTDQINENK